VSGGFLLLAELLPRGRGADNLTGHFCGDLNGGRGGVIGFLGVFVGFLVNQEIEVFVKIAGELGMRTPMKTVSVQKRHERA
jgi:hypothetical protein